MKSSTPITRRQAIAAATSAVASVTGAALLAPRDAFAQQAKPNIIYIMADDLGYADLSCYGRRDYQTPNIDRLAAGGMRFTQAYANSSVCSATRTALITGRYQYRLRIGLEEPLGGTNPDIVLPKDKPTLPSLLRDVGYGTTLLGKWHLGSVVGSGPLQNGYDHFFGFRGGGVDYFTHKSGIASTNTGDLWDDDAKVETAGYLTDLLGQHAVKVITDSAKVKKPFFISLHFNAPHWPWEGPNDEAESKRIGAIADYDGGSLAIYATMVAAMDRQVGNILAALDRTGVANNTIVIFTSDNGGERFSDTWPFSGRKTELLEGGLRIPAIVRWPGHIAKGSVTKQVGISMDWLPTLVAAAGAKLDPNYLPDGANLLPVLTGGPTFPRKLYWRYKYNSQEAVRDGDMKWLKIRDNTYLFNVVDDPLERANLSKRQPDVYKRLTSDYAEWSATMLPLDPKSSSAGLGAATNPDRPNSNAPAPGAKGAAKGAPAAQK
ncbi:MAG: sulfatase-like hydrolase/transferase [Acidobacteriota bacterium]